MNIKLSNKEKEIINQIPILKIYLKSKIKNEDYKDVLQDTLIYLLIKTDEDITVYKSFKGYVLTICTFFIKSYYKEKNKESKLFTGIDLNTISNYYTINTIISTNKYDLSDDLYKCILSIKKDHLNALELKYIENYSIKEISLLMNTNENTIKTNLNRCKKIIKDIMKNARN